MRRPSNAGPPATKTTTSGRSPKKGRRSSAAPPAAWPGCCPDRTRSSPALCPGPTAPPRSPRSIKEIAGLVDAHRSASLVALFGHEPDVSELLAHILGTAQADRLSFKKGGAALVELDGGLTGRLVWFLPPRVLRDLGE
jgi:hypothetical protein